MKLQHMQALSSASTRLKEALTGEWLDKQARISVNSILRKAFGAPDDIQKSTWQGMATIDLAEKSRLRKVVGSAHRA